MVNISEHEKINKYSSKDLELAFKCGSDYLLGKHAASMMLFYLFGFVSGAAITFLIVGW
jgi:hypothetical protein